MPSFLVFRLPIDGVYRQPETFTKFATDGASATRRHCVLQTAPCCFMRPFELFRLPIDGVYRQPCPFVQIFDLGIKGYTAAQRARLKKRFRVFRLPIVLDEAA